MRNPCRWILPHGFGRGRGLSGSMAAAMVATVAITLLPHAARAHVASDAGGGFVAGFLHPISGLDHLAAMLAVGLWGAVLGPPAVWVLPVAFPLVMAIGGALALLGLPIPGVEVGIALSGVVIGLMVLLECRPPLWLAALIVATFAVFHGHANGAERPPGAVPCSTAWPS